MDEEDDVFSDATNQKPLKEKKEKPECNTRIDELAKPKKIQVMCTWKEHACHFEQERVEKVKQLLLELYALTPEETENYFARLREDAKKMAVYKKRKAKFQKLLMEKRRVQQRLDGYRFFKKLLRLGLTFAAKHEVPPVVSVRLRYFSDIILDQLCYLKDIERPDRENADKEEQFLISVADWIAIGIEHVYYEIESKKQEELLTDEKSLKDLQPIAESTPRQSLNT